MSIESSRFSFDFFELYFGVSFLVRILSVKLFAFGNKAGILIFGQQSEIIKQRANLMWIQ